MVKMKVNTNRKKRKRIMVVPVMALLVAALTAQPGLADTLVVTEGVVQGGTIEVLPPDNIDLTEEVVYDLYQVATAEPVDGYDAYTFKFGGFQDGADSYSRYIQNAEEVSADSLNAFAQDLAKAARSGAIEPYKTNQPVSAEQAAVSVEAGMYLAILHGADDTDYWDEATGGEIVSAVDAMGKRYVFAPMVISLPNRGLSAQSAWQAANPIVYAEERLAVGAAAGNTANTADDWTYKIAITSKAAEKERFGSLQITKTITGYETMEGRTDPGTFVFRVTARAGEDPGSAVVYSNVASVVLTAAGTSASETLHDIPVGSYVTVEEIYAGPNYTTAPSQPQPGAEPIRILADDSETGPASVSFTNTYDGSGWDGGGSVKNHFEAGGSGWDNDGSVKTTADHAGTKTESLFG